MLLITSRYIDHRKHTTFIHYLLQMVVTLRWMDDKLDAHEEFIGLHSLPSTEAGPLCP